MDDKQLLDAIRGIVQEETVKIVDAKLSGLGASADKNVVDLETSIDEKLAANNEVLLRGVNVIVENKYQEILNLLKEDYSPVAETARKTALQVQDYPEMRGQMKTIQNAVQNCNERITALETKAAI